MTNKSKGIRSYWVMRDGSVISTAKLTDCPKKNTYGIMVLSKHSKKILHSVMNDKLNTALYKGVVLGAVVPLLSIAYLVS